MVATLPHQCQEGTMFTTFIIGHAFAEAAMQGADLQDLHHAVLPIQRALCLANHTHSVQYLA